MHLQISQSCTKHCFHFQKPSICGETYYIQPLDTFSQPLFHEVYWTWTCSRSFNNFWGKKIQQMLLLCSPDVHLAKTWCCCHWDGQLVILTRIIAIVHTEMMLSNQHTLKIILMVVITVTIVIIIIIGLDQTYEILQKQKYQTLPF